jgi:hypothetical protein
MIPSEEQIDRQIAELDLIVSRDNKQIDHTTIIDQLAQNPLHLRAAYEVLANAEYWAAWMTHVEDVARAEVYLEIAKDVKHRDRKVDHNNALIQVRPCIDEHHKKSMEARRRVIRAKGLVEKFTKRSFALTDIANLLRRLE